MSRRGTRRPGDEPVPSISNAQVPLAQDQARRTRVYLIQMGIRIVCILGAIVVGPGWFRWVLIAAAVILPYTAVLGANAGRDQAHYDTSPMQHPELPSAGSGADRLITPDDDRPSTDDAPPGGRP